MGNKPTNHKYKKLFDPSKFDIEKYIEYYQFMEKNFPLGDVNIQIDKCSKYFLNLSHVDNLEQYMHEGTYIMALIRELKRLDKKNNIVTDEYYDKLYKEIYDILLAIR